MRIQTESKPTAFITTILTMLLLCCPPAMAAETNSVEYAGTETEAVSSAALQNQMMNPDWNSREFSKIILTQPNETEAKTVGEKGRGEEQIGFSRAIEQLNTRQKAGQQLKWQPAATGGHVATLILTSPGAVAIRMGIRIESMPEQAELRFFNPDDDQTTVIAVTGESILHLLAMNLESANDEANARLYWSPSISGEAIGLELFLPDQIQPNEVKIAFPMLSHLVTSPVNNIQSDEEEPPGTYCANDATCYNEWSYSRKATAKMIYTSGGYTYYCTGVLLNDADRSTSTPYFATANHCINDQATASTLETHWFYESSACDGKEMSSSYRKRSGGAELLWTKGKDSNAEDNQDFTLLLLLDSPPSGAVFAGWSTERTPDALLTGIHHPSGALKKISFAYLENISDCFDLGSGEFYCIESEEANFLNVVWSKGGGEPGSSGSGIFNASGKVVGVLSGGWSPHCRGGRSYYSDFQAAYISGDLGQWLNFIPPEPVTLKSLRISGPAVLDSNTSASYSCTAIYSDGTTEEVTTTATWEDDSPYATIGSGGFLYASRVARDTSVTITASYGGATARKVLVIHGAVSIPPLIHLLH